LSIVGYGTLEAIFVLGARLFPKMVMNSPLATPAVKGEKLAAFTMPVGLIYTDPLGVKFGAWKATVIPR
jgi:hypothetical protein